MTDLNALIDRLRKHRCKKPGECLGCEAADALERQNNALKIIAEQGGDALAAWEKLQAELVEERHRTELAVNYGRAAREVAIRWHQAVNAEEMVDREIAAKLKEKDKK